MPKRIDWRPEDIARLGAMSDAAAAKIMGASVPSVAKKRKALGIPQFKTSRGAGRGIEWTQELISLLGKQSDADTAALLGVSKVAVVTKRNTLGITPFDGRKKAWSQEHLSLLGKTTDYEVARVVGKSRSAVVSMRTQLGIPAFLPNTRERSRLFLDWGKFALLDAPEVYTELKKHYKACFGRELSYGELARLSFYSESRMQKWFTAGSAQQPLSITTRHHLWLLGFQWGRL